MFSVIQVAKNVTTKIIIIRTGKSEDTVLIELFRLVFWGFILLSLFFKGIGCYIKFLVYEICRLFLDLAQIKCTVLNQLQNCVCQVVFYSFTFIFNARILYINSVLSHIKGCIIYYGFDTLTI